MNPPNKILVELVQLFSNKKFNDLINKVDNLLNDYPDSWQLWNLLGSANLGLEKLDEAILNYDLSIDKNKKYAPAYNNKGNALRILGKREEALDCYSKAIAIEPNFADAYNGKAYCLEDMNRPEEAAENFKIAKIKSENQKKN